MNSIERNYNSILSSEINEINSSNENSFSQEKQSPNKKKTLDFSIIKKSSDFSLINEMKSQKKNSTQNKINLNLPKLKLSTLNDDNSRKKSKLFQNYTALLKNISSFESSQESFEKSRVSSRFKNMSGIRKIKFEEDSDNEKELKNVTGLKKLKIDEDSENEINLFGDGTNEKEYEKSFSMRNDKSSLFKKKNVVKESTMTRRNASNKFQYLLKRISMPLQENEENFNNKKSSMNISERKENFENCKKILIDLIEIRNDLLIKGLYSQIYFKLKEINNISQEINDPKFRLTVIEILGKYCKEYCDYPKAIKYFKIYNKICNYFDLHIYKFRVYKWLSEIYQKLQKYSKGKQFYYLGDLKKAMIFHSRMAMNMTEPSTSPIRQNAELMGRYKIFSISSESEDDFDLEVLSNANNKEQVKKIDVRKHLIQAYNNNYSRKYLDPDRIAKHKIQSKIELGPIYNKKFPRPKEYQIKKAENLTENIIFCHLGPCRNINNYHNFTYKYLIGPGYQVEENERTALPSENLENIVKIIHYALVETENAMKKFDYEFSPTNLNGKKKKKKKI